MKKLTTAVLIVGLLHGVGLYATDASAEANTKPPLPIEAMTDEEKINYSLGFKLGKDLRRDDLRLLPDTLLRGAEDGTAGRKAVVNTRQRTAAAKQIQKKRAKENLEKSLAFLAANAAKEGVQTLPSGLQYREIQAGKGETPKARGSVEVNYRGSLIDGTEFDSSYNRDKPKTFQVKKVIKGWREALLLMQEGAKWELYVPPDLAYGKRGRKKVVPPNSALIYEVELISVK